GDAAGRTALAGRLGTRLDLRFLLEEVSHRRLLHHKGEGLVLVIGDDDRDRHTLFQFLRGGIERLAEFHDVNATLTKCRANRRGRVCRPCTDLQLELACNFLSHFSLPFYPDRLPDPFMPAPAGGCGCVVRWTGPASGRHLPREQESSLSLPLRPFRPERIPVRPGSRDRRSKPRP